MANIPKHELIQKLKDAFSFAQESTTEQLEKLAEHAIYQEVEAGTIVAEKGSYCHGLALVLAGELRVSMTSEDGREVTLYRITKGRICPLSAACVLGNFTGNTVTVTTEADSKVAWVQRGFFLLAMSICEPFYRFVINDISSRLFQATEIVDSIAFVSVKKRLAQLLLAESNNGKHAVYKTHEALARELGTAREVVSRELKNFERSGILSLARGRLVVNCVDDLNLIAEKGVS